MLAPLLKRSIARVAYDSGALSLWRDVATRMDPTIKSRLLAAGAQRGGLIFMFHRICDRGDPYRPGVSLELFRWFCEYLKDTYDVLPLSDFVHRYGCADAPHGAVAITFDDGFEDAYRLAFPVLRGLGLPATVFVTTGAITGEVPLWFERLAWIIEHSPPAPPMVVEGIPVVLDDLSHRLTTLRRLQDRLKTLSSTRREGVIRLLGERSKVSDFPPPARQMLSWDQLREMDAAGFSPEAHTVSHPILSRTSSRQVRAELAQSKAVLEAELGRPVTLFAYPNGQASDYDARVIEAVRRAGFEAACTTVFGANTPETDRYQLRRVSLYAEEPATIAFQVERFFYQHH